MAMVSVKDVALRAGVSVGTVSNVMNFPEKVSAKSIARVQSAIDELGFIRNDAARQLRQGRSTTIGLVVLDVRNPFFADVARGSEVRAASAGLSVLLATATRASGGRRPISTFSSNNASAGCSSPRSPTSRGG